MITICPGPAALAMSLIVCMSLARSWMPTVPSSGRMKICFVSCSSAAAAGLSSFFGAALVPDLAAVDGFVDWASAACAGARAISEASSVAMVVVGVMVGIRVVWVDVGGRGWMQQPAAANGSAAARAAR